MTGTLKSITLTDFRSIRGSITVPLDAPVVLVHGQNGAGKTSLLSGIELALTGSVPSLQRVDPEYLQHLVHKDAKTSQVHLSASGLAGDRNDAEMTVSDGSVAGIPLLSADPARFYSERCFLAQSSLGRLLELYQDKDTRRSDSPLTKFVKDLLGLDHLDAVIDGLHDAGDVRRFRSSVPLYGETKEDIPVVEKQVERLKLQLATIDQEVAALESQNGARQTSIANILPGFGEGLGDVGTAEEQELQRLTAIRREITVAITQWKATEAGQVGQDRAAAERQSAEADSALLAWRQAEGKAQGGDALRLGILRR